MECARKLLHVFQRPANQQSLRITAVEALRQRSPEAKLCLVDQPDLTAGASRCSACLF
jgi:hypothetical protein